MEESEGINIKSLRAKFQTDGENFKIRTKPVIPEKPKTIPSPTPKMSNSLVASINSTIENRTHVAPHVIFREGKINQQSPLPETVPVKVRSQLLDRNQKKEADLIKEALKTKKSSLVLPTSLTASDLLREGSTSLKTTVFNFDTAVKNGKTDTSERETQSTPLLDNNASSISIPSYANPPVDQSVIPKAPVPRIRSYQAPPAVSVSKVSAVIVPEPDNHQTVPISKPIISVTSNSNAKTPEADVYLPRMPDEVTLAPEMDDVFEMYIPPPIITDDFPDSSVSTLDIPSNVTPVASLSNTPVASNAALYQTFSPALVNHTSESTGLLLTPVSAAINPDSDRVFTYSPSTLHMEENTIAGSSEATDHTVMPQKIPSPAFSALARAEEMTPTKHNPCDQRLINLLQKSKLKSETGSQQSTILTMPESMSFLDTTLPYKDPFEYSLSHTAYEETPQTTEFSSIPEISVVLPDTSSADFEGNAMRIPTINPNTQTASISGIDQKNYSPLPRVLTVQKPIGPPPPPPKKHFGSMLDSGFTQEKPPLFPSTDLQTALVPLQQWETSDMAISAPDDFASEVSVMNNSAFLDSQVEAPDYLNTKLPVEEEAILKHSSPEHQFPEVDYTDSGLPRPGTSAIPNTVPDTCISQNISSPSRVLDLNTNSTETEDIVANKKSKTQKKLHKGSPLNPYADTPVMTEEIPKKTLFSKKNTVSGEKDLKIKEKQKQKEKKKETKEKDKDKKGLKEKEKEKKEQKDKDKKETEMKKKFGITGNEEDMYQATVRETSKGRKDDLAVKTGDVVSIIRTTDCPKGKWLARDSRNKYGFVTVENMLPDIKDMQALGNLAKATSRFNNGVVDPEVISTSSRLQNHLSVNQESFTDESEEWIDDEDSSVFPTDIEMNQRVVSPVMELPPTHKAQANTNNVQPKNEALQKLATFFAQPKPTQRNSPRITEPERVSAVEPVNLSKQEIDLQILPPPDLYADIVVG